jgi:hypothetical protein
MSSLAGFSQGLENVSLEISSPEGTRATEEPRGHATTFGQRPCSSLSNPPSNPSTQVKMFDTLLRVKF